jgi:preprotein translocase subunit SecE
VAGFYFLAQQGPLVQWGVLVAGLIAAAATFSVSEQGKQLLAFGKDSWKEVKKVVWPTRKESLQMTAYVFAFVVVMALFLWLTDKTLEWVLYDLILGWRS